MQSIDAIEGVLKDVLAGFQKRYSEGELDDTEYAQNVKIVIEEAGRFMERNPEIGTPGSLLKGLLYESAKSWWLERVVNLQKLDAAEDGLDSPPDDEGYLEYYFDHIYRRGTYPV